MASIRVWYLVVLIAVCCNHLPSTLCDNSKVGNVINKDKSSMSVVEYFKIYDESNRTFKKHREPMSSKNSSTINSDTGTKFKDKVSPPFQALHTKLNSSVMNIKEESDTSNISSNKLIGVNENDISDFGRQSINKNSVDEQDVEWENIINEGTIFRDRKHGDGRSLKRIKRKALKGYSDSYEQLSYEKMEGKNYIFNYTLLLKAIYGRPSVKYQISPFDYDHNEDEAINLKFTPFKILSVNEKEQSVSIASYVYIKWRDDALKWEPSSYNNISRINVRTEEIWTPTIIIPQANGDGFVLRKPDYVSVDTNKNDNVKLSTLFKFTTSCELDLSVFPFDTQACSILFRDENNRRLTAIDRDNYTDSITDIEETSGEWDIVRKEVEMLEAAKVCPDAGDSVMYTIVMARRSTFYVANLLIPLHMTSFVALFVFWIPPETGEKISFMVSMYVSTAMYLSFINDVLPHSLTKLPAFNVITVCINIQIALTFIASLFVLRQYRQQTEETSKATQLLPRLSISSASTCTTSYSNPHNHKEPLPPSPSPPSRTGQDSDNKDRLETKKPKMSKNVVTPICSQEWSNARYDEDLLGQYARKTTLRWLDYRFLDKMFFVLFTIAFVLILMVPWLINI